MVDNSPNKSYPEKNNLHYFTSSRYFEKPIKAVIRHLPPNTSAEDISNILEDLRYNINVRQITVIRRAPNGQTHAETLPLFLVTSIINKVRVILSSDWPYAVLQLTKLWPCLGQL
jgi:hypothetical protein